MNNASLNSTIEHVEMPVWCFGLLCIVAFVGSIGNTFIIGAVCMQKRLRVRGNAFIINLAVADLIITAYIMPMGLATTRFEEPPFGDFLCDINGFLIMCSCGVSTQSLMMVAVERYVTICKTHWYPKVFSVKTITIYIILAWVYSGVWTAQGWTGWTIYFYGENIFMCIFDGSYSFSYDICLALFGMILPMVVLFFCYTNIFRVVWKSRTALATHKKPKLTENNNDIAGSFSSEQRRMKREVRLAMTLFTIVIVFTLLWLPAAIVLPMSAAWPDTPRILFTISLWIAVCNSSINSIIYGAMNYNFRQGYQLFFSKLLCLRGGNRGCDGVCHTLGLSSTSGDRTRSSNSPSKDMSLDTSLSQVTDKISC